MKQKAVNAAVNAFTRLAVTLDISSLGTVRLPEKAVVKFNVKEVHALSGLFKPNTPMRSVSPRSYHKLTRF